MRKRILSCIGSNTFTKSNWKHQAKKKQEKIVRRNKRWNRERTGLGC